MAAVPASECTRSATNFANCLSNVIINPLLLLIFTVALLVFVYGIVEFMWGLNSEAGHKEQGKQHMLWGLVGMFIMAAAWAILKIIVNTVGYTPGINIL